MVEEMQIEQALQGIDRVLKEIKHEREEQIAAWGSQTHDPVWWYARLGEEFGEVGKEIAESDLPKGALNLAAYRKECIHTAAVAAAMVQCIDDGVA